MLKCYLNTLQGLEPVPTHPTNFSRTHYDALSEVVDPDRIYEAITRLYGPELDSLDDEALVNSPGKAIVSQFARIHRQVKSEAEVVKAGTR